MPTIKEIRIQAADGKVVDADRDVHVTTQVGKGGPDFVKWTIIGGGVGISFTVRFTTPSNDPFSAPPAVNIPVPNAGSAQRQIGGQPGNYKYSVFNSAGVETDDPKVIIDS